MDETGTVDIKLSRAIDIDGTKTDTLRMREPLVRDQMVAQEQADGNQVLGEVILFANLCGIPPEVMKNMRVKDYNKVRDAYLGFTA